MYRLFHGNDAQVSRSKLHAAIDAYKEKEPAAPFIWIDEENFSSFTIPELTQSQGLFGGASCIGLDLSSENVSILTSVEDHIHDIQKSTNHFFIFFPKKATALFKKYADKEIESTRKEGAKEEINLFALTDALGRRDKKNLWVLFEKARRKNVAAEEIHGLLFWQLKSLLLVAGATTAEEAGMKSFSFNKTKSFLRNFKEGEIEMLTKKFVHIYHDARKGRHGLDTALERFILTM